MLETIQIRCQEGKSSHLESSVVTAVQRGKGIRAFKAPRGFQYTASSCHWSRPGGGALQLSDPETLEGSEIQIAAPSVGFLTQ